MKLSRHKNASCYFGRVADDIKSGVKVHYLEAYLSDASKF